MWTNDIIAKNAAIYVRVSTEDQAERGTIESQIEYADKYCDLNKIKVVKIYKDDGITGTLPLQERPAGAELLQDAKNKLFNTLLVYKLDRLGRVTRVILNAIYDLEQYNIKLKSMTEPFDTSDASGRFLLTILAGVADLERSNILDRMWLGSNRAAKEGKWLGGIVPYGYFKNADKYLEINETKIDGIDMSEADVIRLIFKLAVTEGLSTVKIATHLNSLNIPPSYVLRSSPSSARRKKATAGKWLPGRIGNMLRSSTYMGIHQYGKRTNKNREIIERKVPAIISEDDWRKAQSVLTDNQIKSMRNTKNIYLLRGLIVCENCGRRYHGTVSKGAAYYTCAGRKGYKLNKDKKCIAKSITMSWLDDAVWEDCMKYINNPELALKNIEEMQSNINSHEEEKNLLDAKINDKKVEKERILALYRTGVINMNDITGQLSKINDDKLYLENRLREISKYDNSENVFAVKESANKLLKLLKNKIDSCVITQEFKQNIINLIVDRINLKTVGEGKLADIKISIHYKFNQTSYPTKVVNRTDTDSCWL